ncbi:NAD-dependent protein deacetylase sirtuin-3, mitochondrial [Bulinus truncatus]|nr:NAD-dependent protein deacetylase sirtuin-3, mitochondrial [Bulinus truncatus]
MKRIMAAASASIKLKGQMRTEGFDKSPSLSPSPPRVRRYGTHGRSGNQSDSDSGITAAMQDLNLGQQARTPKQFETRRTFGSNGSCVILRHLRDVANMLKEEQAKNVVIVAGAGISTPSGIPDFRTPGTGLYDNLQRYNVPYPEAIFDIDFFHHNPHPFFALAKELYPSGKYRPNYIHYFARLLNDRGMLLRMYTQNIDGLERLAGVPPDKLVEAHGTFSTATCVVCHEKYRGSEIKDSIFDDKLPKCKKRGCYGTIKPDIVFFGEELPKRFYFYLKDMLQTDMVLILGTSLEVQPFAGIIDTVRWTVPRVLFNRTTVGPFKHGKRAKDFVAEGELLENLQNFVHMAGMKEDMVDLITQSEGTFRLAAPPPVEAQQSGATSKTPGTTQTNSVLAAMWRQNARADLYSDSDSSESTNSLDSDSDSSSSSEKLAENTRNTRNGAVPAVKNDSVQDRNGISQNSMKKPLGLGAKPPIGKNRNNSANGNSGQNRNFSSLLSRRKENGQPPTPMLSKKLESFQSDIAPLPNAARRKTQIAATLNIERKPPPGSHPVKPRSNSVNQAVPEKAHSKKTSGFRSVIDRVRSSKPPPKLTYQHRPAPKPAYDARILSYNPTISSSSDDDDDDYHDDIDDDSTSDDSR